MVEIKAYPYLTIDQAHVNITAVWKYLDWLGSTDAEEIAKNWNSSAVLEAKIEIQIDFEGVLEDCGLGLQAAIRLVIGWRSAGTMLRGSGSRIDLNKSNCISPHRLSVQISGADVSHDITLFAAVILTDAGSNSHLLSPNIPGSVLWIIEERFLLRDSNLYFPIEITDFHNKEWKVPPESVWYLDWDQNDLYQTIFGDVQLYLNASHPMLVNALGSDQLSSEVLQQILYFDVARILILGVLANPDFVNEPAQYPEGTIGSVVFGLLCEYFPNDNTLTLYEKSQDKSLFDAYLQQHLMFLRD